MNKLSARLCIVCCPSQVELVKSLVVGDMHCREDNVFLVPQDDKIIQYTEKQTQKRKKELDDINFKQRLKISEYENLLKECYEYIKGGEIPQYWNYDDLLKRLEKFKPEEDDYE